MNHGRKQHDSHMGSKTLAGKQPHGLSKHGNKQRQVRKVNSHWALAKQGPFSFSVWKTSAEQLATLDHHFLVFALGLDIAIALLPWPLVVGPLPFMAAGLDLVAAVAFCSWSSSQSSWRMVPPIWMEFLHGKLHSWQVALLATLRMNTQLPHGFFGFWHWTMMSHSSNGRTWSSSGWARVAVAVAMVPLAAGFPRVAGGFFMGMAAGTEAHSGAWASHWCGQSGCRKEMHLNHMV